MQVRYARTQDIPGIDNLLSQVLTVHHNGRRIYSRQTPENIMKTN